MHPADPNESLEFARQVREKLLREERWLTSTEVQQRLGATPDAANRVNQLRTAGELLGVWDGHHFLYPQFQFDSDSTGGQLIGAMKELLEILPKDESGWRQAFWLFQPHAGLEGHSRPADAFRQDSPAVIRAARGTFAPGDQHW